MEIASALTAPILNGEHQTFGPVEIDVSKVGDARIKRAIYPPGLQWSTDLKPLVGKASCDHVHAGFLAHGSLRFQYADGCTVDLVAPAFVDISPGHDAWVLGDEPAVLIEVDFETVTAERLGVGAAHEHER